MDEFHIGSPLVVNYEKVLSDNTLLGVTRLLANDAMKNSYITVGKFLKQISNTDLQQLIDIVEDGPEHKNYGDIVIIAEMLAVGEGLEAATLDITVSRSNQFLTFITCESLARKGFVKVYHENMSFGDDMANAIVVEKL